jgi:hypothetical protein
MAHEKSYTERQRCVRAVKTVAIVKLLVNPPDGCEQIEEDLIQEMMNQVVQFIELIPMFRELQLISTANCHVFQGFVVARMCRP